MKRYIQEAIANDPSTSISYSTFMELALYHPDAGYYMKKGTKIGKEGDFYTSSSVSPIFAETIASVFVRIIDAEAVQPIIIELGGGNGSFAKQVVETWKKDSSSTYQKGHYFIVETSPFHRSLIQEEIHTLEHVSVVSSLEEIKSLYPSFKGIIFSNEFFDAFPVDLIKRLDNDLKEIRVTTNDNEELVDTLCPLQSKNLLQFIDEYGITLSDGQTYEVPSAMCSFIRTLGDWIEEGIVLTIDYGYRDEEWSLPFHKDGSLRGYYKHQLIKNPLQNVGEMDLTTHIHFDKLIKAGKQSQLDFYGMYRQDEFLLKAGLLGKLQEHDHRDPFSETSKRNRAIRSLLLQGGISSSFHIVVQSKGVQKEQLDSLI
ncbi:SAM-dependent MidA family methyltransferase [Bacillus mesophilus]|uniref:SAM-dependent methyltransferase n=1 Tax=Bacillus mesophilus TaxID=1808955 RepID=A0A6M0Q985_9BACI|nr:SAM-dependent methyltransferase [Bacillus mesophilus]MBM7660856.1 SAM-dependent MidA family methyltransferase [Bacillus mesophilus]NEY71598.1 SAM-dependent methyltransferase [Bacillus mesophilus]